LKNKVTQAGREIAGFAGGVANYYSGGEKTRRLPQMPRDTEIRKKKEIARQERRGKKRRFSHRDAEAEIEIEKAGERAGAI